MADPSPGRNSPKPRSTPAAPRPSASILLVSPTNKLLLLHRLSTSSSFPSAHVFPGGNYSTSSDGPLPPPDPSNPLPHHADSLPYRLCALRELFEETGILLARPPSSTALLEISPQIRTQGRKAVHSHKTKFRDWVKQIAPDSVIDTNGLLPFTHWITPPTVPRRYSTQMYLYFAPEAEANKASMQASSDGGLENTSVEWKTAAEWLQLAWEGEVVLFPPQVLLLTLVSQFLDKGMDGVEARREALRRFVRDDGNPPWERKFISPVSLGHGVFGVEGGEMEEHGHTVLALDKPGLELKGTNARGDEERVVLVKFRRDRPRGVKVRWRRDVVEELKEGTAKL